MSYAQEMKNLAAEIKTSHKDRTASISGIKGEADDYMRRVSAELKEMARNLKDFLAKSEEARKSEFRAMMGEIRATIKEIKGEVKNSLAKSEEKRMADFKATMKDVTEAVEAVRRHVKGMLGDYKAERKEAAGYWSSLGKREVAVEAKEGAEEVEGKEKKKGKK